MESVEIVRKKFNFEHKRSLIGILIPEEIFHQNEIIVVTEPIEEFWDLSFVVYL
jgi:hypothetical protein